MRWIPLLLCLVVTVACQPSVPVAPTFEPFPTMTPGQTLSGVLPISAFSPPMSDLASPATAVALTTRPTPTPNRAACPALSGMATLGRRPETLDDATTAILRFLQEGGSLTDLREDIRVRWQMLGEEGYALDSIDLTGEGVPDIVLGWSAPGRQGMLHIIGCRDGLFEVVHEVRSGTREAPRLLRIEDINNAPPGELVYTIRSCDERDNCEYVTQALAWDSFSGRFRSLLAAPINTLQQPELRDVDNDRVQEIVVTMNRNGNTVTGPLRRGVHIYDWNGSSYVLSIIQLEPPRYYIQIAHEGDRQFSQLRMAEAALSYQTLLNATDLRYWYNDEAQWLRSYGLYRLLLAYAFENDPRQVDVALQLNTEFSITPGLDVAQLPVYALMAYRFLDAMALSGDLHQACLDVQTVIAERPEAVDLLNRYGTRSPTYTALDLCPF